MIDLETDNICLNSAQHAVYSCICYFDVFSHPVTEKEILEFTGLRLSQEEVTMSLDELLAQKLIARHEAYYFLQAVDLRLLKNRLEAEQRFLKKQKLISRFARMISAFPFVESVSISGSCSKGLFDRTADVDYFIITSPQRVWLCRTLLIAFKKVFLLNSKKYFCVNYFVDANHLLIPDKNTFVATEVKTLVPVSNKVVFEKFLNENDWADAFLPNKNNYSKRFLHEKKPFKFLLGWMETLFKNSWGDRLDKWCFELTLSSWEKKFPYFSRADFDLNLRSRKTVSKHHPRGYQQKVLLAWNKKLEKIKVMAE